MRALNFSQFIAGEGFPLHLPTVIPLRAVAGGSPRGARGRSKNDSEICFCAGVSGFVIERMRFREKPLSATHDRYTRSPAISFSAFTLVLSSPDVPRILFSVFYTAAIRRRSLCHTRDTRRYRRLGYPPPRRILSTRIRQIQ